MYKEGLYNKLDNLLRNLNLNTKYTAEIGVNNNSNSKRITLHDYKKKKPTTQLT